MSASEDKTEFFSTECTPGFSVGADVAGGQGISGFTFDLSPVEFSFDDAERSWHRGKTVHRPQYSQHKSLILQLI